MKGKELLLFSHKILKFKLISLITQNQHKMSQKIKFTKDKIIMLMQVKCLS